MKKLFATLVFSALAAVAGPAAAVPVVSIHASNVGIASIVVAFDAGTNTITITENWSSAGMGSLLISGLDPGVDYTVKKIINNNSGVDWTRFANEVLDPSGQDNDLLDPVPQPAFVPAGFSTSNDFDGLSFAQGSALPRTSSGPSGPTTSGSSSEPCRHLP